MVEGRLCYKGNGDLWAFVDSTTGKNIRLDVLGRFSESAGRDDCNRNDEFSRFYLENLKSSLRKNIFTKIFPLQNGEIFNERSQIEQWRWTRHPNVDRRSGTGILDNYSRSEGVGLVRYPIFP